MQKVLVKLIYIILVWILIKLDLIYNLMMGNLWIRKDYIQNWK